MTATVRRNFQNGKFACRKESLRANSFFSLESEQDFLKYVEEVQKSSKKTYHGNINSSGIWKTTANYICPI